MFLKLLLLLSTSGQELRMVILALLLGLTMLRRYSLVTHTMMRAVIKHPGLSLMQFLTSQILSLVLALLLSQTNCLLVMEWCMILSAWKPWKHLLTPTLLVMIS